jgi:hypothetical protein
VDLKEYKSGTFTNQFGYRSFHPELLNREWMVSQPELVTLLETANTLIRDFENLGILIEQTGIKRNRIFIFEAYLGLLKN